MVGPDVLPAKREKSAKHENIPFAGVIGLQDGVTSRGTVDDEFDREFDYEYIPYHVNKEIAFLFKRDKTLIEADLISNLPPLEQYSQSSINPTAGIAGFLGRLIGYGSGDAVGHKRVSWYLTGARNRPAFNACIKRIDAWDFDRIIPCHGDVVEPDMVVRNGKGEELGKGGKAYFRKLMEWHLAVKDKAA